LLGPLLVACILAAFLLSMLWLGGAPLSVREGLILAAGAAVVVIGGEILLSMSGLGSVPARLPVAVVLGTVATSLVLLAGVFVTGSTAAHVFLVWAAIVAAAGAIFRRKLFQSVTPGGAVDIVAIACLAVLAGFWCRRCAAAFPDLRTTGVLPAWNDYYIHGTIIAQFGDLVAVGQGAIELAGQAPTFYHYAAYMISAAVRGAVDLPGLALATCVLLPIGLLIAAIGSYALATALAGRRAGALTIAFLTLLPDPSTYGLANGFFGFYWNLFSHPGTGYALGSAAVSLVFLLAWFRSRQWTALIFALAIAVATLELRAHIFLWLVPAVATAALLDTAFARRHLRWIGWSALGCSLLGALLLWTVTPLRRVWLEWSWVAGFLDFVHQKQEPTGYPGLYESLVAMFGSAGAVPFGVALLIPGVLGVFVLLYPLLLAFSVKRRGWQTTDFIPLLVLCMFVLSVLFAPVASPEYTELKHRAIALLYHLTALWSAVYVCRLIFHDSFGESSVRVALALVGVTVLSILYGSITGADPAEPRFAWGKTHFGLRIRPALVEAADYVRTLARPGDIFAMAPTNANAVFGDVATEFVSLTDVPCYLARPGIQLMLPARQAVTRERLARLQEIESSADRATAMGLLRDTGVDWYVVVGAEGPGFDPARAHAAFAAREVAIYRVGRDDRHATSLQYTARLP